MAGRRRSLTRLNAVTWVTWAKRAKSTSGNDAWSQLPATCGRPVSEKIGERVNGFRLSATPNGGPTFWHHPGVSAYPSALSTVRQLALAWVCFGPLGAQAVDVPLDPALLGCWRAERVEQTLADGSLWTDIGGCTLEFADERIVSACALRERNRPITYTYKIVEPGKYRARITDHPARPEAEGSERDYEYRVDRDRLFIVTYPQTAKPAPASSAVRVLSVSVRVGSPTDLASSGDVEKAGCRGRLVSLPVDTWLASTGLSSGL